MSCEPLITIWGKELSIGQSMTLRVALTNFRNDLKEDGLGEDEMGKVMTDSYLARAEEILSIMLGH